MQKVHPHLDSGVGTFGGVLYVRACRVLVLSVEFNCTLYVRACRVRGTAGDLVFAVAFM